MKSLLSFFAQNVTIPSTNENGMRVIPLIPLTQVQLRQIISLVFLVVGGLAVLFILVGAARYAASRGEPSEINQAKNTLLYAVIGLVISLSAFAIVQFVLGGIR